MNVSWIYFSNHFTCMWALLSHFSHVQLFVTPWTVARQVPLSMGFSRQEHWSGLPFPSPGDLPDPGVEPRSPALQTDSLPAEPQRSPQEYYHWSWFKLISPVLHLLNPKHIHPLEHEWDIAFVVILSVRAWVEKRGWQWLVPTLAFRWPMCS